MSLEVSSTVASASEEDSSILFVILDHHSYIAGDKVTGEIMLKIFKSLDLARIKIKAFGEESIIVYNDYDRNQILMQESKKIFTIDDNVQTFNSFEKGDYIFPFSFKLPGFIPATFDYSGKDTDGNLIKSKVNYLLSVVFYADNKRISKIFNTIFIKNINHLENPGASINVKSPISGCCFQPNGISELTLLVESSDHLVSGGELKYKIIPNNSLSKSPIIKITSSVYRQISFTLQQKEFQIKELISKFERNTWIGPFSSIFVEKDFDFTTRLGLHDDESNTSSNDSALIQCKYFIEVHIFHDILFRSVPIVLKLPFHVDPQVVYVKVNPPTEGNWIQTDSDFVNLLVKLNI